MTSSIFDTIKATRGIHFQAEYGAEDKYAAAVAAHDADWFAHKELCASQAIERLKDKGVTGDAKLLEKELNQLQKGIAVVAYHNDGSKTGRRLEISHTLLVTDVLTYHALSQLAK